MPKENLWNALYCCVFAIVVALIIFFVTAPSRLSNTEDGDGFSVQFNMPKCWKLEDGTWKCVMHKLPKKETPLSGSRGDGDYDRWRRSVIDRK